MCFLLSVLQLCTSFLPPVLSWMLIPFMPLSKNTSILKSSWLLGKPSVSSCKLSFLTFLTYSSKLSLLPICPDFLSSAGSEQNKFLTLSKSNPPHGETLPSSRGRETTTLCCAQLAPLPRNRAWLLFLSLLLPVLHSSEEAKEKKNPAT